MSEEKKAAELKDMDKCTIEYFGYENPETVEELQVELHGLETAKAQADLRIANLKMAFAIRIAQIKKSEASEERVFDSPPKDTGEKK